MPSILETLRSRVGHQTSGAGGLLSGLGGSGGILSTAVGPLQSRLASIQAAGTPQAKLQSLVGTLGTRMRTLSAGGGLLSKIGQGAGASSSSTTSTSMEARSGTARTYANPQPPSGVEFG